MNPDTEIETIANIRARRDRPTFEPFEIVTASGRSFTIPTADHLDVPRIGTTLIIYNDRAIEAFVAAAQVSHVVALKAPRKRKKAA